jgi:CIC family chloride channel protein
VKTATSIPSRLAARLRRLSVRLGIDRNGWIFLLASLLGVSVGVAALGFILPIHAAERLWTWAAASHPQVFPFLLVAVPTLGGLLTALVTRAIPLPFAGHGVSAVVYAVALRKSSIPLALGIRQWLASSATLMSGGSAGPEGPIASIGSSIGSSFARRARLDAGGAATLVGSGAAAGIAAVFNAPFAGVFFALEVLLGDFSIRTFTAIVVSAVLASATVQTVLGTREPLFGTPVGGFDPVSENLTVLGAPVFLGLGVVCGLVAVLFIRSLRRTERTFGRIPLPAWSKPAIGGLLLGLLGLAYLRLLSDVPDQPAFMGSGYALASGLLDADRFTSIDRGFLLALLAWLVLKGLATCLTLGSGGSGGLFAPSLVLGAIAGALYGSLLKLTGLFPDSLPAHTAIVGMAGVVAATTHAPMCGIMLAYELTRDYGLILPLMLTAVIATVVGRLIERESIYTAGLAAMGIRLGARGGVNLLRELTVGEVPPRPVTPLELGTPAGTLLQRLEEGVAFSSVVVVDRDGRYAGSITEADLRAALLHREAMPLLDVGELIRRGLPRLSPADTLEIALDRLSRTDADALPVLDDDGRPMGTLTRDAVLLRYRRRLESTS